MQKKPIHMYDKFLKNYVQIMTLRRPKYNEESKNPHRIQKILENPDHLKHDNK